MQTKKFVILGGTGTLGSALARELLKKKANRVLCFSRDELKQKELASKLQNKNLMFCLGDIRDLASVKAAVAGAHAVFHVAALKHIDALEANPEESVKTNILGTMNVADACIEAGVKYVVFSSTDKAVSPINVYGHSKAISERILLRKNEIQKGTKFSVFRWGNVLASRGSVIPIFLKTLQTEKNAYLTHPDMTRFWVRIEDAVRCMLDNYESATDVVIPKMKAAYVSRVIASCARVLGINEYKVISCGMRPGEKIHEEIIHGFSSKHASHFGKTELDQLIRKTFLEQPK